MKINLFFFLLLLASGISLAGENSKCVLPIADSGETESSPANIEGTIQSIAQNGITVLAISSKQLTVISLTPTTELFTTFGGLVQASELKSGQHVWAWFTNCKQTSAKVQTAAVFQIYSTDPNDKP